MRVVGFACITMLVNTLACASAPRVAFQLTEPTYAPNPGPRPQVYLHRDALPPLPARSVGVITVVLRQEDPIQRATEAAADKGRELGCWILLEHSEFVRTAGHRWWKEGVTIVLAHGAAGAIHGPPHPPRSRTASFDCLVQGTRSPDSGSAVTA